MGWWSTGVMGGDTPLDYAGDIISLVGLREKWEESGYDYSVLTAEILNEKMDEIVAAIPTMLGGYQTYIGFHVLGHLAMERGAELPDHVRRLIHQAVEDDEWAKEGDVERVAVMNAFNKEIKHYDGTAISLPQKGLLHTIAEVVIGAATPAEQLYEELRESESEQLDDMVHDVFSKRASAVNNGGLEDQIELLLEEGYTAQEIRDAFKTSQV